MPCYSPLTGYYAREVNPSGRRSIVFTKPAAFSGVPLRVPCGQCIGCRLERSRQWAMRCVHESQMHRENVFVTLTYDDDHLPEDHSLDKSHLQYFMRMLRRKKGKVRFYGCGEYGENTLRPHYHVILFGCDFYDKKRYGGSSSNDLFTSKQLDDIWANGNALIGDVTFDSAAYVARYCLKKVTGDAAMLHYQVVDHDGVIHQRLPEFTNMSRRPGIGKSWFDKYGNHSYIFDKVVMNGKEVAPPRYYDTQYNLVDPSRLEKLKFKRRTNAIATLKDRTPERLHVRKVVASAKLSQKRRTI